MVNGKLYMPEGLGGKIFKGCGCISIGIVLMFILVIVIGICYEDEETEEKPDTHEEEPDISEEEPAESISVSEIEKDMKTDPIAELEDMGLELDGGKPKFVYYSGHTAVETFEITTTPFVIGRAKSDYAPGAAGVSRRHCYIDKTNGIYYITDLESTNGVWINGRKIKPYNRTALENGDIIGIGDRVYKFEQN